MSSLKSLSIFAGTGDCNANCAHCAGKIHRKYAPTKDGIVNEELISKILRDCYLQGARYLSISSSGEPTLSPLSVTRVLEMVNGFKSHGMKYNPVNLYSNGIRIGNDNAFTDEFLPKWKRLGLTTIYVTVHDINTSENARIYGVKKYPKLEDVLSRIHSADLLMRANLVLGRKTIGTFEKFVSTIDYLSYMGVNSISAWPIRDMNDNVSSELAPSGFELDKMEKWIEENQNSKCHVKLLNGRDRTLYQTGQKLTLFPDGSLSNTWCA